MQFLITDEYLKSLDEVGRVCMASHVDSGEDLLNFFAKDANWHVRVAVADNLAATPEILSNLAKDTNPVVRKMHRKQHWKNF